MLRSLGIKRVDLTMTQMAFLELAKFLAKVFRLNLCMRVRLKIDSAASAFYLRLREKILTRRHIEAGTTTDVGLMKMEEISVEMGHQRAGRGDIFPFSLASSFSNDPQTDQKGVVEDGVGVSLSSRSL